MDEATEGSDGGETSETQTALKETGLYMGI